MMSKKILIEGMTCGHCVGRVQTALEGLNNVRSVSVDLGSKNATIETNGEVLNSEIVDAIKEEGYEVVGIENDSSKSRPKSRGSSCCC